MDDYFSSFMQQTGVSFESDVELKDPFPQKAPAEFGGGDKMAPIEVAEIKQIESGSAESAENHADQPRKETAPPKTLTPEPARRGISNETATAAQVLQDILPAGLDSEGNVRTTERPEPEQTIAALKKL